MDVDLQLTADEMSRVIAAIHSWSDGPDVLSELLTARQWERQYVRLTTAQAHWLRNALCDSCTATLQHPTEHRDAAVEDAVNRVIVKLQAVS